MKRGLLLLLALFLIPGVFANPIFVPEQRFTPTEVIMCVIAVIIIIVFICWLFIRKIKNSKKKRK